MADFDSVFNNEPGEKVSQNNTKRKDSWQLARDKKRSEMFETANGMLNQVAHESDSLCNYLQMQARFMNYSPTNTLLILAQDPSAKMLRTVERWRELGVYMKRNPNKAIYILEGRFSNPKEMYDISATNATPKEITQPDMMSVFKAMYQNSPVPMIPTEQMPEGFEGAVIAYDPANNVIHIQKGLEPDEIFKGLSKEMSLAVIANNLGTEYNSDKHDRLAQCASYILCEIYGVDNGDYQLSNCLIGLAEPKELRAQLEICKDAAAEVHDRIQFELGKTREQKPRDDGAR